MGKPVAVDAGWLREQYTVDGRSALSISKELGCSVSGVQAALRRNEIPQRGQAEARRLVPPRKRARVLMPEAGDLYRQGLSMRALAARYGVSHALVRDVLADAGIHIQTATEAAVQRWQDPELRRRHSEALERRRRPTGVRAMKKLLAQDALCAFCGADEDLEQHHLNAVRSDDRPENIVPLCRDCHAKVEWLVHRATEGLRRAYRGEQPDLRLPA
jgi:hypothetical protein